jgi:amylosucrase
VGGASHGGVPLLWMGDELAVGNDRDWAADPAHADDNRWVHRPRMPWDVAARRHVVGTVEHRVWTGLRDAVQVRAAQPAMHASVEPELLDPADPAVLGFVRRTRGAVLVALHNLSDRDASWPVQDLPIDGALADVLTGQPPEAVGGVVRLAPYEVLWLVPV